MVLFVLLYRNDILYRNVFSSLTKQEMSSRIFSSFDPFLNEKFRFYPNMEGENAAILSEEIIFLH
jgi:hypothetical protein